MKQIARGKGTSKPAMPCFYVTLDEMEENMENKYSTAYNFVVPSPNALKYCVESKSDHSTVWIREDAQLCAHSDGLLHFIYTGDELCVQQLVQTSGREPELFWRDFRDRRPGLTWILFQNILERETSLYIKKAGTKWKQRQLFALVSASH